MRENEIFWTTADGFAPRCVRSAFTSVLHMLQGFRSGWGLLLQRLLAFQKTPAGRGAQRKRSGRIASAGFALRAENLFSLVPRANSLLRCPQVTCQKIYTVPHQVGKCSTETGQLNITWMLNLDRYFFIHCINLTPKQVHSLNSVNCLLF